VIVNELPQLKCTLVDLDPNDVEEDAALESIQQEIQADSPEDEVAYRDGIRYIPRLRKTRLYCQLDPTDLQGSKNFANYGLELSRPGVIENLIIRQTERETVKKREVEIQVYAAGLNFSDVLKTLNLYPGHPEGKIPLGIECAGEVTSIGQGITAYRPGDRVMALVPFSFSAYVKVHENYLMPVPPGMSLEEAATLPLALLTAHYALIHLGHLQAGERVLIHSASGGVGLAAVQIARHAGAEIIATAGTPKKRDYLKSLGISQVFDSRSLAFAQEIQQTTGQGVDVILNSLAGEAINKGLSLLREHGRFLEIGKRDIYGNKRIGLFPFRNNLSFHSIDLDKILREHPSLIQELLQEISALISSGVYTALPKKLFSLSQAQDAFRTMAQAKHIGKLVLKIKERNIRAVPADGTSISFRPEASYLITGGYGGFGLVVADWMADHGARHLILMSRHGAASPGAAKSLTRLKKLGISITEYLGDVAEEQDVQRLFSEIDSGLPPLRGIVHCAMVLEDGMLLNLDEERMFKVMDPKIKGAWNLHSLSQEIPLDFFVLFSSVSSLIGMPGQGNYVAANAFLDGLTLNRRAQGLPSTTINWGYLGKVGIAARSPAIAARFEKQGLKSFSPGQAMELLSRFLLYNVPHMAVINMDWSRFGEVFQSYAVSPKFSELWDDSGEKDAGADPSASGSASLRKRLLMAVEKDKPEILKLALLDQVAKVLGTSSEKINTGRPLTELGFDSLMAVELRNWIENNLGVVLPTMEVMRGPSLEQLSEKLLATFMHTHTVPSRSRDQAGQEWQSEDVSQTPQALPLDSVDELSDQEVDDLLASLLKDND
jgi:NADPH:quinone reductase-like Zn-dependent oxidoreductase/acyl carrier protein